MYTSNIVQVLQAKLTIDVTMKVPYENRNEIEKQSVENCLAEAHRILKKKIKDGQAESFLYLISNQEF